MRKLLLMSFLVGLINLANAQAWKPADDKIKTAWAEKVDPAEILKKLIPFGYSAAVYTQTTDVESEVNGLMTYDRKVIKLNEEQIRKINQEVCNSLKK